MMGMRRWTFQGGHLTAGKCLELDGCDTVSSPSESTMMDAIASFPPFRFPSEGHIRCWVAPRCLYLSVGLPFDFLSIDTSLFLSHQRVNKSSF